MLSAEPKFNSVIVKVEMPDISANTGFTAPSPTTGKEESYPPLPPEDLKVTIHRGDNKDVWSLMPVAEGALDEKGVFTFEDTKEIKAGIPVYYKAEVQAAKPFLDATKLKPGAPLPAPSVPPAQPAATADGKPEISITTLSPWKFEVAQSPNSDQTVRITVENQKTHEKKPFDVGVMPNNQKIGDTNYKLINVIQIRNFSVTIDGTISEIMLDLAVANQVTGGNFVNVWETKKETQTVTGIVWQPDPFDPSINIYDNNSIIAAFAKKALDDLAKTSGGLNLGKGKFNYEDNFITRILQKAVNTFPPAVKGPKKDALGRQLTRHEYQGKDDAAPVRLITFDYRQGLEMNQALALYIHPVIKNGVVTYFADYGEKKEGNVTPTLSGPYPAKLPGGFDMSAADKLNRLVTAITPDIDAKLKDGTFKKAAKLDFKSSTLIDEHQARKGIGFDNLGLKGVKIIIQYQDVNTPDAPLMESPVISVEKFVAPAPVAPPPTTTTPAGDIDKKLNGRGIYPKENKYDNIQDAANKLTSILGIKVTLDSSVKFEGIEKIGFTVTLDNTNITAKEFLAKHEDAYNKAIAGNDKAEGKQLKHDVENGEIILKLEQPQS